MKLTRVILACTLLLSASLPLFALPQCGLCISNVCTPSSESLEPCKYVSGVCENYFANCSRFAPEAVLADWTVASVEISRPGMNAEVVTTAADVAEVCTTKLAEPVRTALPTETK